MKYIVALVLSLISTVALSDTYQLTINWSDSTVVSENYVPAYNLEWKFRDTGTSVTRFTDLPSTSWTGEITAPPGVLIDVRVQNKNTIGPLLSDWSNWTTVITPYGATPPANPAGVNATIIHTSF